jgi:signal transduction histidine kinase
MGRSRSSRPKGPAPAQAGANLLVHDLKNLAGRLAALVQNLGTHYDDPLFKGTALGVLDDTVMQLRRLAGDLRSHDGRVIIKLKVDLNKVLADALAYTLPGGMPGELSVLESFAEIPPIWGDALLLRQAFTCAIENALAAMRHHGTIAVATRVSQGRKGPRILVEIADDGPGMSEEFLRERLFNPFSTTKEDGLGLGVYTIRQVAILHGGTVRIRSTEGEGTRVRFHFPAES